MCGGRDQPAGRGGCRAVFPYGGSRWVVGIEGLTAVPEGWWRGARRVGTERDGFAWATVTRRSDAERRGFAPAASAVEWAVEMRPALKATVMRWLSCAVVRYRRFGGVVRGVSTHGVGAAPRRPSAGVVVRRAGPLQRGAGGRPRAAVGRASRFPVRDVTARPPFRAGRAATGAGPPATGTSPGARSREFAIRIALGPRLARLVRAALVEGLAMAAGGLALRLAAAWAGLQLFAAGRAGRSRPDPAGRRGLRRRLRGRCGAG